MVNASTFIRISARLPTGLFLLAFAFLTVAGYCQEPGTTPAQPGIQDNSFLVEEAYNQNFGVVQHISSFTRFWNSKDWVYSFTQEWPAPGNWRHQLSYTLAAQHAGAFPGSGVGFGDVLLNYRYQLVGDGDARVAFSPRASLILPTGDTAQGRSLGGLGVQTNLPLSVVVKPKLVTHWNVGATFLPNASNVFGERAFSSSYNLGQSFIWLAKPRLNFMLETVFANAQVVTAPSQTAWVQSLYINPGLRWAYNFKNGLQIVPGIGVPLGVGPSGGEKAVLFYLSFEHPFRKIPAK